MNSEERIQFFQMSLEDLKSIIIEAINSKTKQPLTNTNGIEDSDYHKPHEILLTRKEAAAFLKISTTTLWSLDKKQQLPAKRLNGKVLYFKSDILTFLNKAV